MSLSWMSFVVVGLGMSSVPPRTEEPEAALRGELWSAVTAGDLNKVKSLLDRHPSLASIRNEKEVSAPLLALYYRKQEIADLLLARKEKLEPVDVFEAAAFGRVERLNAILEKEPALVNAFAADGFFPLGLAAFFGREDAVKALLARGADPNLTAQNAMRVRALHAAAAAQALSIAKLLIAAGADVNARQEQGFTPLQEAALSGQMELARLLLDGGAHPDAKADDGRTALDMAREKNQQAMVELLSPRR